jgi:HDOD domain
MLEADAVDLRDVGDAIRIQPELEVLVLNLCNSLALSPGVPVSNAEEAVIVMGKDRLRIVVQAWSVNQWTGDDRNAPRPETSAEILGLANCFQWARRTVVSLANSGDEYHRHRLDLELKQATRLTNLLVKDLLILVSSMNPAGLTARQEAVLQEILQARE